MGMETESTAPMALLGHAGRPFGPKSEGADHSSTATALLPLVTFFLSEI